MFFNITWNTIVIKLKKSIDFDLYNKTVIFFFVLLNTKKTFNKTLTNLVETL